MCVGGTTTGSLIKSPRRIKVASQVL